MTVFLLTNNLAFPPPQLAREDGLLAVGGDLSESRLVLAYQMGIFPWFSSGDPILWWSPDPRLVLLPHELKISKSLQKVINKDMFRVTMDTAFEQVIGACAQVREKTGEGTWIVSEMIDAYCRLHRAGFAHSVESWCGGELAGGLYGVSLGRCFFGESMFTRISNASKVAFVRLVDHLRARSFRMIDCQVATDHLMRFGAKKMSRETFLDLLALSLQAPHHQRPVALFRLKLPAWPDKTLLRGHMPARINRNRKNRITMKNDCIFCQIASGESPTNFLYEDDDIVVFKDIHPAAPVHLLIVPRRHIRSINDLSAGDGRILSDMFMVAKDMAARASVARTGYKLLFNVEKGGGQEIFHLHLHLIGGW